MVSSDEQTADQEASRVIRVALVDDHRVVRRGLRSLLESYADLRVVGEASSGEEALDQIEAWHPDVLVMDLLMPGGIDGVEAIQRARALAPRTQIVALTSATDDAHTVAALRAGAIGYVRKDADPALLVNAVRSAARGQATVDPTVAVSALRGLAGDGRPTTALTEREREVLTLLAQGRTNREIAEVLVVSPETVKTHVANILTKLNLSHRAQVALYAVKQGLVSLDDVDL